MLAEPGRTQFDLHFTLFGVPVRIHPFFWLMAVLLGAGGAGTEIAEVLIWVGVVFFSILLHEFGHAAAFLYFGYRPRVVLYSFGGLAIPEGRKSGGYTPPARINPRLEQIIISFAGPLAGFLLAGVIIAILFAVNRSSFVIFPFHAQMASAIGWRGLVGRGDYLEGLLGVLVFQLLFLNFYWGLMNCLPVYPLDGGQISRQLFLSQDHRNGVRHSLMLSIGTAAIVAVAALAERQIFLAILFGWLAYNNYQLMQMHGGGGGYGGGYGGGHRGGRPW